MKKKKYIYIYIYIRKNEKTNGAEFGNLLLPILYCEERKLYHNTSIVL